MIAACPKCSARYRIERGRLGPNGARLRCSQCRAVFRVRAPEREQPASRPVVQAPVEAPADVPAPDPAPALAPEAPPSASRAPAAPGSAPEAAPPAAHGNRERLVLIADPMIEEGKANASALASWGLQPVLVHDGVEAILAIQRTLPRAVIIDAALPKMYGFQICELLKRNESLRDIHVVLVGAIHDRNRYRRPPTELYGADAYLERPQLPDALRPILQGFGMEFGPVEADPFAAPPAAIGPPPAPAPPVSLQPPPRVEAAAAPPAAPRAVPQPAAPELASAPSDAPAPAVDPGEAAEIAKAERLARIVVSDIILYNQEKFDAAVQSGDVLAAMDAELVEGRTLFAQRIDARIRESRDFLNEELLRMARMRRSQ
ncbi:MAG: zinc-ribbon domain-containing protein [Myxococcota bacterium]